MKGVRATPGWRLWLMIGAVAYALFLVALLPAGLAWEQIRDRAWAPQGVTAQGISGTLWSGSAVRLTLPNGVVVYDMNWRFRPVALLTAQLEWQLSARPAGGHASGRVALGARGLRVSDARADLDAASVITPVPLVISGTLVLDLQLLALTRSGDVREAHGVLGWLDAGAGLPDAVPLGSLRAELDSTNEGGLRLDILDQGGPLIAEGTVVVDMAGRYRLDGLAGARSDADPRLAQTLGMLGTPDRSGRTPVHLSGSL